VILRAERGAILVVKEEHQARTPFMIGRTLRVAAENIRAVAYKRRRIFQPRKVCREDRRDRLAIERPVELKTWNKMRHICDYMISKSKIAAGWRAIQISLPSLLLIATADRKVGDYRVRTCISSAHTMLT
jgi:hypothetical protein